MPRPVTALIIDDEPHVVILLRGMLKQLGTATVWEAADGAQGLEQASARGPDVVILDLNLPQEGGLEVLAKLKAKHPALPVVIVSAQSTMRTINKARELGALSYVLKHAPKSEVLQMLSDAFDVIAAGPAAGPAAAPEEKPKAPA
jgi:DNA-binding NarL/FixJ family response regulator